MDKYICPKCGMEDLMKELQQYKTEFFDDEQFELHGFLEDIELTINQLISDNVELKNEIINIRTEKRSSWCGEIDFMSRM